MKAWFNALTTRERATISVGGIIAVLVLVHVALVEPVADRFRTQRERVESLERDLAWMTRAAPEVIELRNTGRTGTTADSDEAPYLALDEAFRSAGLPQPESLEPVGQSGARAEFEAVAFDPLIFVLDRLRRESGLHVTRAQLTAIEPGIVSARLTLERMSR